MALLLLFLLLLLGLLLQLFVVVLGTEIIRHHAVGEVASLISNGSISFRNLSLYGYRFIIPFDTTYRILHT